MIAGLPQWKLTLVDARGRNLTMLNASKPPPTSALLYQRSPPSRSALFLTTLREPLRLTLRAYRRRHRRDRIVRGEPGVGVAGGWRVAAAAPRGRIPRPAHRSRSHSRELSAGRLTRSREMMMCRVRAETVRARRMSPASLRAPRGARMIGGGGG